MALQTSSNVKLRKKELTNDTAIAAARAIWAAHIRKKRSKSFNHTHTHTRLNSRKVKAKTKFLLNKLNRRRRKKEKRRQTPCKNNYFMNEMRAAENIDHVGKMNIIVIPICSFFSISMDFHLQLPFCLPTHLFHKR